MNTNQYNAEISTKIKSGDLKALEIYLVSHDASTIFSSITRDQERNLLHDVCDNENKQHVNKMLDIVFNWHKNSEDHNKHKFLDIQDAFGNTPLHYAILRKNRSAVKQLILRGANVYLANNNNEKAISWIYKNFTRIIPVLMHKQNGNSNHSNVWNEKTKTEQLDEHDCDNDKRNKTTDFRAIVGVNMNRTQVYETSMISNILHTNPTTQEEILENPTVQHFIDVKWKQLKWSIYSSMLFHITWCLLTCNLVCSLFTTTHEKNSLDGSALPEDKRWDFDSIVSVSGVILFTILLAIKEFMIAHHTPNLKLYFLQFQNMGQIFVIQSSFFIIANIFTHLLPGWLDYSLSIVTVIISFLLMTSQMKRHPWTAICMSLFLKALRLLGTLLICILPILLAFTFGLHMFLVTNLEITMWPPSVQIKSISATTTRKDDKRFKNDVNTTIYSLIFIFTTTLASIFSTVYAALIIHDVKCVREKARHMCLLIQLKQIDLLEEFTFFNLPRLSKACWITDNNSQLKTPAPFANEKFLQCMELPWKFILEFWDLVPQFFSTPTDVYSKRGQNGKQL